MKVGVVSGSESATEGAFDAAELNGGTLGPSAASHAPGGECERCDGECERERCAGGCGGDLGRAGCDGGGGCDESHGIQSKGAETTDGGA